MVTERFAMVRTQNRSSSISYEEKKRCFSCKLSSFIAWSALSTSPLSRVVTYDQVGGLHPKGVESLQQRRA